MRLTSRPSRSLASSGSHSRPQIALMTFQPAPRNAASSSWMIWPLPRTGPSSRCRLQLTTKIRLSSFSRAGSVIAPSASGSSVSPSPRNAQTFGVGLRLEAAILQVAHEARLVDRHERAEAHRHRRDIPRSRASATDADTTTDRRPASVSRRKFSRCVSSMPPFEKRARVDAGRRVALEEDDVAVARAFAVAAEEMVEARLRRASPPTRRSKCGRRCLPRPCSRGRPSPRRSSGRGS